LGEVQKERHVTVHATALEVDAGVGGMYLFRSGGQGVLPSEKN